MRDFKLPHRIEPFSIKELDNSFIIDIASDGGILLEKYRQLIKQKLLFDVIDVDYFFNLYTAEECNVNPEKENRNIVFFPSSDEKAKERR